MVFWNKGYNVNNKILWHNSSYIVKVFMWPKLVTLAFLWEKLSQPQFYKHLTRKATFFEGWSWFKFNNYGLASGRNLKFYTSEGKGLKLIVRKFWWLISTFVEVLGEKLIAGGWVGGFLFPILNRVNCSWFCFLSHFMPRSFLYISLDILLDQFVPCWLLEFLCYFYIYSCLFADWVNPAVKGY